jgi:hypothetical protein
MPTQNDKDLFIEKLLEQHKTYREIMKIAHVSPSTIKKVEDQLKQANTPLTRSKRIQAFEIFDRQTPIGSNVYQVITELDISAQDVEKFQVEYLSLKRRDKLALLLGDEKLLGLIPLHREMLRRGMTMDDLEKGLGLATSLAQMEARYQELGSHIRSAKNRIIQLDNDAISLKEKSNILEKEIKYLSELKEELKRDLSNSQIAVDRIKSQDEYGSIEEIAKNAADVILDDRRLLIAAAGASIVKTFGTDLTHVSIFNNPAAMEVFISYLFDPGPPGNENQIYKEAIAYFGNYCDFLFKAILDGSIDVLANSNHKSKSEWEIAEVRKMISLYKDSPYFVSLLKRHLRGHD